MNNLRTYIIEKLHLNKDIKVNFKDDNKLYIFIPYGYNYDYFYDNFNKNYYRIKFNNHRFNLEVWFLTEKEILKCKKDKTKYDNFDVYEIPEEYSNIDDLDELADKLDKANISLDKLKPFKF